MTRSRGTRLHTLQQLSVWLLGCLHTSFVLCVAAKPLPYEPLEWNRSCNYTVQGIPASTFFARAAGSVNSSQTAFPLSPAYKVLTAEMPVTACFGPGDQYNQTLVAAGLKMPCGYVVNPGLPTVTVDYWEENACQEVIATNCYCYAIGKAWHGGYCMPGYRKWGDVIDHTNCSDVYSKVVLDGGIPVTREQVYSSQQHAQGHYIALVLWPQEDFHFFRRDSNGLWSQKRGDTFVTNTFPNGSLVMDVEDPAILGAYKEFCGYFLVNPETHLIRESFYAYQQGMLERLAIVEQLPGADVNVTRLDHPSVGWARLSYPYYMFGLDAAVFEQGDRRLPWQGKDLNNLGTINYYKSTRSNVSANTTGSSQQRAAGAGSNVDAATNAIPERSAKATGSRAKISRNTDQTSNGWARAASIYRPRHHWQFAGWRSSTRRRSTNGSSVNTQGQLRPHWMSHAQQHVSVQHRDEAVRTLWHGSKWHIH